MTSKAPYIDYATYLARYFEGKIQKLTVNTGRGCPNRDGRKGRGGCTYCNPASYAPSITGEDRSVTGQLEAGKQFFAHKYPAMRYLAYFQSYTNTYGDVDKLISQYREALEVDGIVGLVIGTRPDMLPGELVDELSELAKKHYVMVELGAESSYDATLERVNRCHTWSDTVDAVTRLHLGGIHVGLHLIMGLPGETRPMMMETVDRVLEMPVDVLKFHHLQVLKGTAMARQAEDIRAFELDEYLDLCVEIVRRVDGRVAIERFTASSPADMLIKPRWGLKNHEFVDALKKKL